MWGSIQTYVWGVRTWMQSQHQADPAMGVRSWDNFMDGVKVLTWVPAEPRRRCPVDVVGRILEAVNLESFQEVQLAFIILSAAWRSMKHWRATRRAAAASHPTCQRTTANVDPAPRHAAGPDACTT